MKVVTGDNLLFREGLAARVDRLREELAGLQPSPLEVVLVERIVCCWLLARYAEAKYAENMVMRYSNG